MGANAKNAVSVDAIGIMTWSERLKHSELSGWVGEDLNPGKTTGIGDWLI